MSAEAWDFLLQPGTDLGLRWGELSSGGASLGAMDRLARDHGPEVARFVSLQLELGKRASARFPDGRLTFFTAKGLEQASGAAAADERAERFRRALSATQDPIVWDACCGIGSDALALARAGLGVIASDLDPESVRCASGNLHLEGPFERTVSTSVADATQGPPPGVDPAQLTGLFDPDRRRDGVRSLRPADWTPTLSATLAQCENLAGSCVKLAPGLEMDDLGIEDLPGARVSWLSVDGEMKEIDLWLGSLGSELDGGTADRLAVRRTRAGERFEYSGSAGFADEIEVQTPRDGDWLVELDVALWQSGLAPEFASQRGLGAIESGLRSGFLIAGSEPEDHGMMRSWRVLAQAQGDPKRVRAMLRAHGAGPVTVKTRGIKEPADRLASKFGVKPGHPKLGRGPQRLLAITLLNGKRTAFLLGACRAPADGTGA